MKAEIKPLIALRRSGMVKDSHRCSQEAPACPYSPLCHMECVFLMTDPGDQWWPRLLPGTWLLTSRVKPHTVNCPHRASHEYPFLVLLVQLDVLRVSYLPSRPGLQTNWLLIFFNAPAPLSQPSFPQLLTQMCEV